MAPSKMYQTGEEVITGMQEIAQIGIPAVVYLHAIENCGVLIDPSCIQRYPEERIRIFEVKNDKKYYGIQLAVLEGMLSEEQRQEVKQYHGKSFSDSSYNGECYNTKLLITTVPRITLQLVHHEEWWQAFGGAHVVEVSYFWLINSDPLVNPVDKNSIAEKRFPVRLRLDKEARHENRRNG